LVGPTVFEPEDVMTEAEASSQADAPGDQGERVRRATKALAEMRDLVRGLGPIPPGPDRDGLYAALHEFTLAAVEAFSGPKRPRKPRRGRSSVAAGWVGGG
jgi:hypothetical protein